MGERNVVKSLYWTVNDNLVTQIAGMINVYLI